MNLVPFYAWEDVRVWAPLNHSFDTHLSYWGPGVLFVSILNPLRVHSQEPSLLMTQWLQHPF